MMKKKILTIAVLSGCFITCLAATVADVNGKWAGSVNVGRTNYPLSYTFKTDNGKLTGTVQVLGDPKPINDGTLNGTDLVFNVADDNGGTIPNYGKYYADGDSISMNLDYEGTKLHTTLKRATDK
jgi:hypothetical protein